MSFLITAYKNRTRDFSVDLFEADGVTPCNLASADVVRVKIGRGEEEPDLDLSSIEPTASKSSIAFTPGDNTVIIRLAQGDLVTLSAGMFDMEVAVVDNSEDAPADACKTAEVGVLSLIGTLGGEIGEEESSASQESSPSSSLNSSNSSSGM